VTTGAGGGPRDDRGAGRYAPSQADLRDPVRRARAARELRGEAGGPGRGVRSIGLLAGCLIISAATVVVVLVLSVTLLKPVVGGWVTGVAYDNPSLLGIGFVADMVRDDLGTSLTDPAGSDVKDVPFAVAPGDTAATIATHLSNAGVLKDPRAFLFLANERDVTKGFQSGDFVVRQTMTPDQLISALLAPPPSVPHVVLSIRTGLRLEQIAALIEAKPADAGIEGLTMSPKDFVDLVRDPPAALLTDYPWLKLPRGAPLRATWPAATTRSCPTRRRRTSCG
jgi:hypothetical protein